MEVKEFRAIKKDSESIRISGFGGQGVLLLGDIIVDAAAKEGNNITWLPSYGPESRGGTSNCHVVVSKKEIGSPVVNEPD
ncbi:MAG: 2-oxoacid:acceptor oxidoreductase family protein, partial [Candidatus Aenigmarchaeota archaeon]|nr:2-oxoacid:acceptor oxidoreductase family protein [Candidatus Aenigmarchaeota archaeon]